VGHGGVRLDLTTTHGNLQLKKGSDARAEAPEKPEKPEKPEAPAPPRHLKAPKTPTPEPTVQ